MQSLHTRTGAIFLPWSSNYISTTNSCGVSSRCSVRTSVDCPHRGALSHRECCRVDTPIWNRLAKTCGSRSQHAPYTYLESRGVSVCPHCCFGGSARSRILRRAHPLWGRTADECTAPVCLPAIVSLRFDDHDVELSQLAEPPKHPPRAEDDGRNPSLPRRRSAAGDKLMGWATAIDSSQSGAALSIANVV